MTDPTRYPLAWPPGWPRTPEPQRKYGRFNTKEKMPRQSWARSKSITVAGALKRIQDELDKIDARYPIVSTNVNVRLDGLPRSGEREPTDPGVCVYFQHQGHPTALPCDRYTTVAGNLAAIAAHLEATRAIERHGVGTTAQMLNAFQAIRGPGPKPWREVFGIPPAAACTFAYVMDQYRDLARRNHPDAGGSEAAMAEINAARDAARKELGA